jgi:peptidoglycan/xylan/chitin deacetylase (PgdA/CDA1 family)
MLFEGLKKLLYALGLLAIYHRLRNAHTLTVVMFHRVLDPTDVRWAGSDMDFTLRADIFDDCLRFFVRHYNIVPVSEVLAARRGQHVLPPRALLITFDDGWADNVDHALPRLQSHGLPGLIFVVANAVDRRQPFFQERIVNAWLRGRLSLDRLAFAVAEQDEDFNPIEETGVLGIRVMISRIERLQAARREAVLQALEIELHDSLTHMVSSLQLRKLAACGVEVGAHGMTHDPLPDSKDLEVELVGARRALAAHLGDGEPPIALSFPHGRFDPHVVAKALAAGYELLFTSLPVLNLLQTRPSTPLLGRVGISSQAVTDEKGRFRPERLALRLFRRPRGVLG